mgnify:CR=1 FL=1
MISTQELEKRFIEVNGKQMAYAETGSGDPIIFQHGNPTSSYLWRNIMTPLAGRGRCVAVDLIGMGDSEKLDDPGPSSYQYSEHRDYLYAAWERLEMHENVTLVLHDWGSALGFEWAMRHPERVKAIVYMESIVRCMSWDEWPEAIRPLFEGFRSDAGETIILDKNVFVERVLPGSVLRGLSDEEMRVYRRPFQDAGEDRRPTLTWPRQIPLDGEPADVCAVVDAYADWLSHSEIPKLFINAEPGAILTGAQREFCRKFPNQTEVTVAGSHFIQEDSPAEIAAAIDAWLPT